MFGYEYQDMSGDGFQYAMLMLAGHEAGGIGQLPAGEGGSGWATYFAVRDTDDTVALAEGLGGRVLEPARDSPYGRIGVLSDGQARSSASSPRPANPAFYS